MSAFDIPEDDPLWPILGRIAAYGALIEEVVAATRIALAGDHHSDKVRREPCTVNIDAVLEDIKHRFGLHEWAHLSLRHLNEARGLYLQRNEAVHSVWLSQAPEHVRNVVAFSQAHRWTEYRPRKDPARSVQWTLAELETLATQLEMSAFMLAWDFPSIEVDRNPDHPLPPIANDDDADLY